MSTFRSFTCQQTRSVRQPKAFTKARTATVAKAQDTGSNKMSSFLLAGAAAAALMTGSPANAVSPNVIENIKDFVDNDGPQRVGERMGEQLRENPQIQELKDVISVPRPEGGASSLEAEKSTTPNPMERVSQTGVNNNNTSEADYYKTGDKSAKGTIVDEIAKVEGPSKEERFASGKPGGKGVKGVSFTSTTAPAELFRIADNSGPLGLGAPATNPKVGVSDLNEARNFTPSENETGQYVNNTNQKAPEVPTEGVQAGLPESLQPISNNGQGGFQPVFLNEENMYDLKNKDEEAAFYQTDKEARSDEANIVDKVAEIEAPSMSGRFGSDAPAGKGAEENPERRFY